MKYLIFLFVLICSIKEFCQANVMHLDTIQLKEIDVVDSRIKFFDESNLVETFNDTILNKYTNSPIFECLRNETALNIIGYGSQASNTVITMRGTEKEYVQVNWNGFPINSIVNGTMNLALIPSDGFNNVSLVYGASGALFGSGSFGGAVNLNNEADWIANKNTYAVNMGYESFNTRKLGGGLKINGSKIQYQLNAGVANSDGYVRYLDEQLSADEISAESKWKKQSLIQNLFIKLNRSSEMAIGMWYQYNEIKFPDFTEGVMLNNETFRDSSLRVYASYKQRFAKSMLTIKGAHFYDYLYYDNKIQQYTAEEKNRSLYGDINFRHYLSSVFSIDVGMVCKSLSSDVYEFEGKKKEDEIAGIIAGKLALPKLIANVSGRLQWNSTYGWISVFGAGLNYKLVPEKFDLRFNISEKYRSPSLSELYWPRAGNVELLPENGFSPEIGLSYIVRKSKQHVLTLDGTVYTSFFRNKIAITSDNDNWKFVNYQNAFNRGFDLKIRDELKFKNISLNNTFSISINKTTINTQRTQEKQVLLYSPTLTGNINNLLKWKTYTFRLITHYSSFRYYTQEKELNAFLTTDVRISKALRTGKLKNTISLICNNIFSENYSLIKTHMMPYRNWAVRLNISY